MQFRGPTKAGDDWAGQTRLDVVFETPEELEKATEQFLRKGFCLVRVSTAAKVGDKKELVLELPDGQHMAFFATIEKLKEPNDKPYFTALFKLMSFDVAQLQKIEHFIKKANEKEVSTDSILDGGFAFDLAAQVPPKAPGGKGASPSPAPRRTTSARATSTRSTALPDAPPEPRRTTSVRSTAFPDEAPEPRRTTSTRSTALPEVALESRVTTSMRATTFEQSVSEQRQIKQRATVDAMAGHEESEMALEAMLNENAPVDEAPIAVELPEELRGTAGDMLMPKKDGAEHDPQLEQKKYTVAFVLLFTKSVQRSGYYADPNHPETVKSKKGLYGLFRKIVGNRREINFVRKAIGKERDLLIDGGT